MLPFHRCHFTLSNSAGLLAKFDDLWEYQFPAEPPTFSVSGGTYTSPQTLMIRDTTPGASILLHHRRDHADHQLLDRPRDRPKRTALGVAVFSFYFVLFGASATDVLANYLSVSLNTVLTAFQILIFVGPLITYPVTLKICRELQATPGGGKTKIHNIVMRSAEGGYSTVPSAPRAGDAPLELDPVPLDVSVLLPALVGSPSYEAVDRSSLGARAAAGNGSDDSHDGDGSVEAEVADGNGAEPVHGGVFRIPRNYR